MSIWTGLPPLGYTFMPSDDVLIDSYVLFAVLGRKRPYDPALVINDAYTIDPSELPLENNHGLFKEKEWYFYTTRTDQTMYETLDGYYMVMSKDEKIYHNKKAIGFKRKMRYYIGKPRTKIKTEWCILEYRIDPNVYFVQPTDLVMCKIFRRPVDSSF